MSSCKVSAIKPKQRASANNASNRSGEISKLFDYGLFQITMK